MQPFVFNFPTQITFGEDTICGIGETLQGLGCSRPLLVTDANLVKAKVIEPVLKALTDAGFDKPCIFDEVPADSDMLSVRKAANIARQRQCDSVIAVGGGSVIDTAKVANIGLSLPGDVLDYEGISAVSGRLNPLIAVPTTAGTGSEVSAVAMVKDAQEHKKLMFASRYLFPDVAILDPKLILSLPAGLTAATGLDALTHAIESYTANTSNAPADGLCLEAMRLIFSHLPTATTDGANLQARSETLVASMMAGVAFTNAGVGIVHALAHSVGAKYGTHHGATNAVFLPHGLEFNLEAASDRYAAAYAYLGAALSRSKLPAGSWFSAFDHHGNKLEQAKAFIAAVRSLIDYCRLSSRLRDLGVSPLSEEDLQELSIMAQTDPAMMFNPKEASTDDLIRILKGAY